MSRVNDRLFGRDVGTANERSVFNYSHRFANCQPHISVNSGAGIPSTAWKLFIINANRNNVRTFNQTFCEVDIDTGIAIGLLRAFFAVHKYRSVHINTIERE